MRQNTMLAVLMIPFAFASAGWCHAEPSKADDLAIRAVVKSIEEAWNAHDMQAYGSLFADDAQWVNVVGMHWRGKADIVKAHVAYHETIFKKHHIKTDKVEVRSIGDGFAIAVVTTTNDAFTTPSGQIVPKQQNRQTYVLARRSGSWKIVHGHNVRIDADAIQHDPASAK